MFIRIYSDCWHSGISYLLGYTPIIEAGGVGEWRVREGIAGWLFAGWLLAGWGCCILGGDTGWRCWVGLLVGTPEWGCYMLGGAAAC